MGYNPSYKWINLTDPIYNWGYNPLTIRGMSHQVKNPNALVKTWEPITEDLQRTKGEPYEETRGVVEMSRELENVGNLKDPKYGDGSKSTISSTSGGQ